MNVTVRNFMNRNFDKYKMEQLTDIQINELIDKSLEKGLSYRTFRNLLNDLIEQGSTTGDIKSENLINYTMLNGRRFKRWEKTLKMTEEYQKYFRSIQKDMDWLVITESWCGDAAHVMPALQKIAEENEQIDMKVVLRDENPELMDQFLTNNSQSIPKLIVRDKRTKEIMFTYGPRPSVATQLVDDYKEMHGSLTPEFKEDLQRWYNKDKGQTVFNDLVAEFKSL